MTDFTSEQWGHVGVRGHSIQTKHPCVPEVIECNRRAGERKSRKALQKGEVFQSRSEGKWDGELQKQSQILFFSCSPSGRPTLFTQLCVHVFFYLLTRQHKQTVSRHFCHTNTSVIVTCVFVSGQQYSEEFGKLSIIRKVPVMKDGSFILTERYSRGWSSGLTS